jgi:MYXO-CTERM domain-containing protein
MLLSLWIAAALAHEGLEEPTPRYESDGFSNNKSCPCGVGSNNGTCSDTLNQSDPNRDPNRVTVYQAGDTITVRLREVIGHTGRWRIAFDDDGADLADFNANILLDEPDPAGNTGNVGQGDLWEFDVTLPSDPCTNCTLQVLQVMNGNTVDPVLDPTGMSTYWQCADLELTGTGGTDTGTPAIDTADTGTGGTTGPSDETPASDDSDPTTSGGGCGCTSTPAGMGWLAAPLLLAVARRRT